MKPYQPVQESTSPEQESTMPDAASYPPAIRPRVAAPTLPCAHPTPRPSRPSQSVLKVCVSIQKVHGLVHELNYGQLNNSDICTEKGRERSVPPVRAVGLSDACIATSACIASEAGRQPRWCHYDNTRSLKQF